jgi:hypothetical protein
MEKSSIASTRTRNWNMKKLIPLTLAAVFALTSGFTMAATPTKAAAPHATQTKVVKKHHKTAHTSVAPAKVKPAAVAPKA